MGMPSRCGVLPLTSSLAVVVELALGMYSLDVGLLMLVDPAGWDPFGEPVGVEPAGPPFLQEVGVVVSAEQRLSHESRACPVSRRFRGRIGRGRECALERSGSVVLDAAVGEGLVA
jgi:hypothetical protein